jgi:hypothetical protein
MRNALVAVAAVLGIGLSGCMLLDAISPEVRLSDAVHQLNDEVRWGRIDLAAQRVATAHRVAFVAQHRGWGGDIRVADADVTNLEMGAEGGAASTVTYQWIDERTMELRATTVRQSWLGEGEGFVLTGEEIVAGDPELMDGAPVANGAPEEARAGDVSLASAGGESDEDVVAPGGDHVAATPAPARARHRDAQGRLID